MKRIALTFFLLPLLWSNFLQAQCKQDYISLFPKGEYLQANGLIAIEGNGMAQKIVNELTFLHPIYLQSRSHKVYLALKENCVGQVNAAQILLYPESALVAGGMYELKVEGLEEEEEKFFQRTDEKGNSFFISWKVSQAVSNETSVWKTTPRFENFMYDKQEGGKQTIYAVFGCEIETSMEVLVKTEVVDLATNTSSIYYLQPQSNERKLWVGAEYRGGGFDLEEGKSYKVRFDLLGAVGNTNGAWTDWVELRILKTIRCFVPPHCEKGCLLDLR